MENYIGYFYLDTKGKKIGVNGKAKLSEKAIITRIHIFTDETVIHKVGYTKFVDRLDSTFAVPIPINEFVFRFNDTLWNVLQNGNSPSIYLTPFDDNYAYRLRLEKGEVLTREIFRFKYVDLVGRK